MLDKTTVDHKGTAFAWEDPFLLDDQLEEDERMIRDVQAHTHRLVAP